MVEFDGDLGREHVYVRLECKSSAHGAHRNCRIFGMKFYIRDVLWLTVVVALLVPTYEFSDLAGKPDAGTLHVRFERGPQQTEPVRHRA